MRIFPVFYLVLCVLSTGCEPKKADKLPSAKKNIEGKALTEKQPDVPSLPWSREVDPGLDLISQIVRKKATEHWRVRSDLQSNAQKDYIGQLKDDGSFADLGIAQMGQALHRLWVLCTHAVESGSIEDRDLRKRLYFALAYYLSLEAETPTAFPAGAFTIPTAYLGTWFTLEPYLAVDWKDPQFRNLIAEIHQQGRVVASHAWVYPKKNEEASSLDPPNADNFRHAGHFMVANFLPYRPVLSYALFVGDDRYLEVIRNTIHRSLKEPVNFADPAKGFWTEGINVDSTVSAHGRQSYLFGYGVDYLRGVVETAKVLKNTPFQLNAEDYDALTSVILDGMQWFVHRGQADYSVLGRHNLYPLSGSNTNEVLLTLANQLLELSDGNLTRGDELQAMVARLQAGGDLVGSRYFWNMEDYVHRGKGFSVVVNMNSTRTAGPENVKPWAQQNFHFGNGATHIYLKGDEYQRARGAWNFRAIPGITAEFLPDPPPFIRTWEGIRGTRPYAGGVSDGRSGVAAFHSALNGEASRARKAWFFHENAVVALGTDIRVRDAKGPVRTTLNQTEWRGPIRWMNGDQSHEHQPADGGLERKLGDGPSSVWHNRVAYIISDGRAALKASNQPTDWPALAEQNKGEDAPAHVPLFHLFIDHEDSGHYSYGMLLDVEADALERLEKESTWTVLANSPALQAVAFGKNDMIGVVFRQPGKFEANGLSIQVSDAIILMLKPNQAGGWEVVYQDPLHRVETTQIALLLDLPKALGDSIRVEKEVSFPTGVDLGRPVQTSIENER